MDTARTPHARMAPFMQCISPAAAAYLESGPRNKRVEGLNLAARVACLDGLGVVKTPAGRVFEAQCRALLERLAGQRLRTSGKPGIIPFQCKTLNVGARCMRDEETCDDKQAALYHCHTIVLPVVEAQGTFDVREEARRSPISMTFELLSSAHKKGWHTRMATVNPKYGPRLGSAHWTRSFLPAHGMVRGEGADACPDNCHH